MKTRKRIGDLLVENRLVSKRDIGFALSEKHRNEPLITTLVRLGLLDEVDENRAWDVLADQINIPHFVPGRDFHWNRLLTETIDLDTAQRYNAIPLVQEDIFTLLGMTNPMNLEAIEAIRVISGAKLRPILLSPATYRDGIRFLYEETTPVEGDIELSEDKLLEMSSNLRSPGTALRLERDDDVAEDTSGKLEAIELDNEDPDQPPTVRFFRSMLKRSIENGASDIHVEPAREDAVIRYRIDGILHEISRFPAEKTSALIATIKVQCEMDIAEKRLPQDGRLSAVLGGQEIDFRVSTLPTIFGEKIVMRLLRRGTGILRLDRLGLDIQAETAVISAINSNSGIILITGPTGSGKSTTLYSVLRELDLPKLNVLTIEDPVEYQMAGITQINVRADIDFTFATILRTVLRQDPDVIMLGEIRDMETAEMAIRSALTGHLVLSTLHTNSAFATLDRLIDMNIPSYLLGASLRFIGAQRLVRRVCSRCKEQYTPEPSTITFFPDEDLDNIDFIRGSGCKACNYTGYKGRIALLEYLEIKGDITRLIAKGAESAEIKAMSKELGLYYPISSPGVLAVKKGITTLEEVSRVLTEL